MRPICGWDARAPDGKWSDKTCSLVGNHRFLVLNVNSPHNRGKGPGKYVEFHDLDGDDLKQVWRCSQGDFEVWTCLLYTSPSPRDS